MNISKTAKAFAIAAVVGLTSQVFGASTNQWWSEDFSAPADIVALTNVSYSAVGQWSTAEGDESSIDTQTLKLDTQGNNLTWTPASASTSVVVLVDADIYLVGSDSEPTGFDPANDVQTAVYLRNYIDDNNTVTSSVLCAYVEDNQNNNVWVELEGVAMTNETWNAVRIEVDYAAAVPVAKFYVDGILLDARGAETTTAFPIANNTNFSQEAAQKVSSVSFRGTGRVDNFVGRQVDPGQAQQLTFDVSVFTNNVEYVGAAFAAWNGPSVSQGTQFYVSFQYSYGADYLTSVRVYTNGTQYVDYDANWNGTSWTILDSPLYDDEQTEGIRLEIDTATLTEGWTIKAYYGADPSGGSNPDPTAPPVIQPIDSGNTPPVAFETINDEEYFSVSFVAPDSGVVYSLQTQATLGGAWTDETDPLATVLSTSANQEITLSAPTDSATTMFFRVKASTAP